MGILKQLKQSLFALSPWSKTRKKRRPPKKSAVRKKKRPFKKSLVRGRSKKKKKPALKKRPRRRPKPKPKRKKPIRRFRRAAVKKKRAKALPTARASKEVPVGVISHYFSKAGAAAFMLNRGTLRAGDQLRFQGHTTHFKQKIQSLQIDRQPIAVAKAGDEVGMAVKKRVREGDRIFKIG